MSEYQYYEFQAIDRPLTAAEQAEISKLSSRVRLTPHRAIFLYNYSDFPGDPEAVLRQYFDAMLYLANWGTWQLIFRFSKALIDAADFQPYCLPNAITLKDCDEYWVLDIEINEEEGIEDWVDGEGWLPRLLPLRDDLLAGDLRLLYLAWLRAVPNFAGYELEEDPLEPPLPPNLAKLSPALKAFVEWVELDEDLVAAAGEASAKRRAKAAPPLEDYLPQLSEAERQEFLLKLVRQEANVDLQLIRRLQELAGVTRSHPATQGQRRLSELTAQAAVFQEKRKQREKQRRKAEKEAAKKKRLQYLQSLAGKEEEIWTRVMALIEKKQARPYDEATALLQDLHDSAKHQGQLPEFLQRFEQLKAQCSSATLMKRLRTVR